jgi:hypothetical protein
MNFKNIMKSSLNQYSFTNRNVDAFSEAVVNVFENKTKLTQDEHEIIKEKVKKIFSVFFDSDEWIDSFNLNEEIVDEEEIDYDLEYFTKNEPIPIDDDTWRSNNIKKIKNLNMFFHKENHIIFEIDEDGFYIFKGLNIGGNFIDHQEEDIPEVILDWVRKSKFEVPLKIKT